MSSSSSIQIMLFCRNYFRSNVWIFPWLWIRPVWSRRDRDRAFSEMQGEYCGGRPMRIRPALRRRGFNGRPFSAIRFCHCEQIFPWNAGPTFRARKNGTNEMRQGGVGLRSSTDVRRKHSFLHFAATRGQLSPFPISRPPRQ